MKGVGVEVLPVSQDRQDFIYDYLTKLYEQKKGTFSKPKIFARQTIYECERSNACKGKFFFYETWDNMEKNKCMLHSELFVQQIGQDKQCFDCSEPLLWTRSSCPSLLSFATRQAGWDDVAIAFL